MFRKFRFHEECVVENLKLPRYLKAVLSPELIFNAGVIETMMRLHDYRQSSYANKKLKKELTKAILKLRDKYQRRRLKVKVYSRSRYR